MAEIFVTAVVILGCYLFMIAPRMTQRGRIKVFMGTHWAHRGLHCKEKGVPENSMRAFQMAVKEGFGIELDVRLTRDEKLIVFHDDTLERICKRHGRVEDMTYEELESCHLSGTSEHIPLFSSVLEYVDGRVPLLIEVKLPTQDTKICVRISEELMNYRGAFLIQSFNSIVIAWYKKHRPDILRGQLSSNLVESDSSPHYLIRFCVKHLLSNCYTRPDFISYKLKDSFNLSLWLVQHLFCAPVAVWTLKTAQDKEEAERWFDMYIFERSEGREAQIHKI